MTDLIFFGTTGCRLCDEAESTVRRAAERFGYRLVYRDIALDDGLSERYGTRIPVVRRDDRDEDLNWPFDLATVYRFLL